MLCLLKVVFCGVILFALLIASGSDVPHNLSAQLRQTAPVDAVQGIVAAFKQHSVVLIGERHWIRQSGDFYIRLVRDVSFQQAVQDIVIEFASRNNQPLLDRYIAGEDVPAADLKKIWRDTTKVASWESPIYAEWLAAIREVNKNLPPARRFRVLAGDTAVDWSQIRTYADWAALGDNNVSLSDVIIHQVLEKKRRAFVVLGSNHITKAGDRNGGNNTTTRIESRFPGSTYVALTLNSRLLAPETENQLNLPAAAAPALYNLAGDSPLLNTTDGLLYLGPRESITEAVYPPESFDYGYVKEVERRSLIEWGELRAHYVTDQLRLDSEVPWRAASSSPRIERLRKQVSGGDTNAVGQFWDEIKSTGSPFIETIPNDSSHVLATFLYREQTPAKSVVLYNQLSPTRNESDNLMAKLPNTDVWYKTYWIRNDMRLSYSLVPNPTPESLSFTNAEMRLQDPFNAKFVAPGINEGCSVLELPNADSQPWIPAHTGVSSGKLEEYKIESKILQEQRRAWIYTPAEFDPKRMVAYPLLICFDGWIYSQADWIPTPAILDNLIAKRKIPPMVAVFVDQAPQPQRNVELSNNQPFLNFVTDELLPVIRQKWHATADPSKTIVCGSSAGGLASAYFAFRRPDVYGNVLSQSGGLWVGKDRSDPDREWLTKQLAASPKLPIRFVLQVGVIEIGSTPMNGPSILVCNRHLRDVLNSKGYEFYYHEIAGGHEPLSWRGGIAEGLIQLIGNNTWK